MKGTLIMEKITIKNFIDEFNKRGTESLKDQYIKDNLEIIPYVPFIKKDALIGNLLKTTMIDKETGNIKVNSSAEYLLMTRIFIENYTNLTVETEGFFEEYDELKKSGLFDILLIGNDVTAPLIPYEEIAEFKHLLSIKKSDILQNKYEIHSFITEQVERFKTLGEATLTPLVDAVSKKLDSLSDDDLRKILDDYKLKTTANFKEV
ncbi:hypothetical protein DW172_03875 [Agathobacter rectalis]|jgi:hypothetical protein|uniref:Uncharacterized protein n=1 Tax=Agathobacter rectalis TaxID=39491 RepID=A0A414ZRF8_9FIRM|nr:hypothetical protein [Agathobacter rectalis]RHI25826.1 hypothetical protein DW172_03875 [Agathobacter rectalis]DAQ21646.1 MAG TPA: hypothetical protein [Caudoviricetes sp.]